MIDEDTLQTLIPAFYEKVRSDQVLGPIFNGAIDDWPQHLDKLRAFWSSVMLGSGLRTLQGSADARSCQAYGRNHAGDLRALAAHLVETTDALLDPAAATVMQEKAAKIAESLSLGIAFQRDRSAPSQRPATAPQAEEEGQDLCPNPAALRG